MYIRINNNIITFPYDTAQLRHDYPNVSFPTELNDEILKEYSIFKVTYEELPAVDSRTQYLTYTENPIFENNNWVIKYNIVEKDEAAISAYDLYLANSAKTIRDKLLSETDWIVLKYSERGDTIPAEWKEYRQLLRDITLQSGFPTTIVWPTKPGGA